MGVVTQTPLPRFVDAPSALDFSGLDALQRGVHAGAGPDDETLRAVTRQFEALLVQTLLRQARQTAHGFSSLLATPATRMAESLGDQQAALALADPGLGLAEALLAQMNLGRGLTAQGREARDVSVRAAGNESGDEPGQRRWVADSIGDLLQKLARGDVSGAVGSVGRQINDAATRVQEFVERMRGAADRAARESGLPAQLILGQAALESGWGEREIRLADGRPSHNLFGIKAGSQWRGETVRVTTTEFVEGQPRKLEQAFRAYGSYTEAFADYARLISQSPRYRTVLEASNATEAARRIQEAGYATDPAYADKLVAVMSRFETD